MFGDSKQRRELALGLTFIGPNVLGFLTFTAVPLVLSLVLAFSNWDLKLHNSLKAGGWLQAIRSLEFVGLDNFVRLLNAPDFWTYLLNTLFLMMGMPVGIAASLISALLLSKDLHGATRRVRLTLVALAILCASVLLLTIVGAGKSGMFLLLAGLAGSILIAGTLGGVTVYRTLFYVPHFTAGIATSLLWKKLYSPSGPINGLLDGPLESLTHAVNATSPATIHIGTWICVGLAAIVAVAALRRLRIFWVEGDVGALGAILGAAFVILPVLLAQFWLAMLPAAAWMLLGIVIAGALWQIVAAARSDREFVARATHGIGSGVMLSCTMMVVQFILIGFAIVFWDLPARAATDGGLEPPSWLTSIPWAKPALMIMGFWGAIGSNTMLLYLAALTNVPQELYEAADIDGASRFQKFWNVTWPQLAPTTFFIVVMGVIGGLQGGFETARVMTNGGPAGATTTLSFFIYTEGFETGRLGFSSAVAWTLFLMVLTVTMFNWKFGNKYVND